MLLPHQVRHFLRLLVLLQLVVVLLSRLVPGLGQSDLFLQVLLLLLLLLVLYRVQPLDQRRNLTLLV